jgi:hypothetical protein
MSDLPTQPAPPTQPNASPGGSLGSGIAIAWACLIGGYIVVSVIAGGIFSVINGVNSDAGVILAVLMCLLPWIVMVALIVHFAKKNQPRTALGIGVGIASIIGVLLLLVAACFGLLSNTSFH